MKNTKNRDSDPNKIGKNTRKFLNMFLSIFEVVFCSKLKVEIKLEIYFASYEDELHMCTLHIVLIYNPGDFA